TTANRPDQIAGADVDAHLVGAQLRARGAPGARDADADAAVCVQGGACAITDGENSPVEELRTLMRRFPSGVAVVTVDAGGQELGLTVGTLTSLSLEPPLVGFGIRRDAALHELLREEGAFEASLLAAGKDALVQHFDRW